MSPQYEDWLVRQLAALGFKTLLDALLYYRVHGTSSAQLIISDISWIVEKYHSHGIGNCDLSCLRKTG